MTVATAPSSKHSQFLAETINPLMSATYDVFETMLGCRPTRKRLTYMEDVRALFEVSAVIGITGRANGTIVFSLSSDAALNIYDRLLGEPVTQLDHNVLDAIGEVTNMIAGSAKSRMAELQLSISIPNVVCGEHHTIHFPTNVRPICIEFDSEIGPFCIEAGFCLHEDVAG